MNPPRDFGALIPTGPALGALHTEYSALAQQMKQHPGVQFQGGPAPAPVMDAISQPYSKGPMTVNPDGSTSYRFDGGSMPPNVVGQPVSKGPMTVNPNGSTTYRFDDSGMGLGFKQHLNPQPNSGRATEALQRLQQWFASRQQQNPFVAGQLPPMPQHPGFNTGFVPPQLGGSPVPMPGLPGGGG